MERRYKTSSEVGALCREKEPRVCMEPFTRVPNYQTYKGQHRPCILQVKECANPDRAFATLPYIHS